MKRDLTALANQTFDVLIIGGGIFGAGIARDAALRGLRVALVDKGDFASGTSSRSSKLIHGGFRYLEQYAFGLVAEACRERRILQDIAPHLVKPLPFLLPVYRGDPRPLWKIRLGMTLYDWLAHDRNAAPHRALSPEEALKIEPSLAREKLRGAIQFHDCQEDDARFCLENIMHAAELGATCANYCEVTGFVARDRQLTAAQVTNKLDTGNFEIRARLFINAAGPWVERIARFTSFNSDSVALSPTKGVHLVLPRLTRQCGIFFQARRDGRMMFILPWGDCTLVGTTDTDFKKTPDDIHAEADDIEYLLDETRSVLPGSPVEKTDIITTFAGVRSLLRSDKRSPSSRRREHKIVRHGENLFSIAGGKYTTYRAIAEQVVDAATATLGGAFPPCRTAKTPLPQHRPPSSGERIADTTEIFASDVTYACEREMAMTVSDVMRRRTGLALSQYGGQETAEKVARLMQPLQKWSDAETRGHLQQYLEEWKRALP